MDLTGSFSGDAHVMTLASFHRAWPIAALAGFLSWQIIGWTQEPPRPTASSSEANPAVPAPGHSVHGEAFNDGPRHRAYLMPGMGKVHFPVTTKSKDAQAFIDQGVAQLHSFYYFESERSFRQAAQLDPGCAMAYWGMAMSNVYNNKRAQGFISEARKRAAGTSRREQLYLDAIEALYKVGSSDKNRRQETLKG